MVNKFIVECPQCKMHFFVTDELLTAAMGNLSCGVCLHIFNGNDYILNQAIDNNLVNDSSTESVLATNDNSNVTDNATSHSKQAFDNYLEEYWREVVNKFSSFSIKSDESDNQHIDPDNKGMPNKQLSSADIKGLNKEFGVQAIKVDGDITAFLDEIDFNSSLQQDEQQIIARHNHKVKEFIVNSSHSANINPTEKALLKSEHAELVAQPAITINNAEMEDDNEVKDIYGNKLKIVKAIDFEDTKLHRPKLVNKMNIVWGMLSILAIVVLVAQYLHYALPTMTLTTSNRKWAEEVCQYLFCQLPVQVDVSKITTDKLMVRSDPNHPGALLVDSIIYNEADFPQPYPIIELRFTNLNGQLVASRRFLPEQYLNNEVLGKNQMPSSMPVYISFQIVDPGEEATGYSLRYFPAAMAAN